MLKKNQTNSILLYTLIYLLISAALTVFIIWIIFVAKESNIPKEKYLPFANLPEFKLSSDLQINPSNFLIESLLHQEVYNDNSSTSNIEGEYKRYPLNQGIQTTSIVAVDATNRQPDLAAWHLQVGNPGLNWLWPDGTSAYWICPVNVVVHPVVVIKGTFPRARYMSLYSYDGIDINNISNVGRGLTKFKVNDVGTCNSSIPGNCAGLADYQIEPDEGSKNPFRDPTFNPNFDTCNYTVYFVSANYKGILPSSKNILPLSTTNTTSALVTLRVYAPFNPIGCNSRDYVNNKSFDTRGCGPDGIRTYIPGGGKDPSTLNFSPCSLSDITCVKEGTGYEFQRTLPENCYKYVGNNQYCVCLDDNPTSTCGKYLDKTVKYYTNNKGNLKSYCAGGPTLADGVSYCIDDIKIENGKMGKDVTTNEKCGDDDNLCQYVKQGKIQQCVSKKLFTSDNPACTPFKNPYNLPDIDKTPNSCKEDFAKMICECSSPLGEQGCEAAVKRNPEVFLKGYFNNQPPSYNYRPEYDFENCPPDCSGCDTYTCEYDSCIPRVGGEYDKEDCDNECPKCTTPPPVIPQFDCVKDDRGFSYCVNCDVGEKCPYDSPKECEKNCDVFEGYTNKNSICNSDVKNAFCNDPSTQPFNDLAGFSVNNDISTTTVASGWVGLPNVFVKYQWNDYFINLNNYENVKSILSTFVKDISDIGNYIKYANLNNPMDPYQVKLDNPGINIKEYSESLDPNQLKENYDDDYYNLDEKKCESEQMCQSYVDEKTYFPIGALYPAGRNKTKLVKGVGCNYYQDICNCEQEQSLTSFLFSVFPPCGLQKTLQLDGSPCFSRWKLKLPNMCLLKNKKDCDTKNKNFKFSGTAVPFAISANTSDVVIFPNPDTGYVAAMTKYDNDAVYVIWMDIPSTPITPSYQNIVKNDYQCRYVSVGHYFYGLSKTNIRPLLSARMDNEILKTPIKYIDQKTGEKVSGNRVCILLASSKQYDVLRKYQCLSKKVTWLDWGVTGSSKLLGKATTILNNLDRNIQENYVFSESDYQSVTDEGLQETASVVTENDGSGAPNYGFIIYRQMLPNNKLFTKSIENYVISNPDCLNKTIPITDEKNVFTSKDVGVKAPVNISKSCNPGPAECTTQGGVKENCGEKYKLDPCCVAKEPLDFMEQYYPRCEKVKICDIMNIGESFWDQYLRFPLPYKYDAKNPEATPKPSACPPMTSPPPYSPQPM